jgi:hypothetical protein
VNSDERQKRRLARQDWIAGRVDDLSRGVIIQIDKGSPWLDLNVRHDAKLTPVQGNDFWKSESIDLRTDLPALAELIRALCARYNTQVRKMNEHAEKIKVDQAEKAEP